MHLASASPSSATAFASKLRSEQNLKIRFHGFVSERPTVRLVDMPLLLKHSGRPKNCLLTVQQAKQPKPLRTPHAASAGGKRSRGSDDELDPGF